MCERGSNIVFAEAGRGGSGLCAGGVSRKDCGIGADGAGRGDSGLCVGGVGRGGPALGGGDGGGGKPQAGLDRGCDCLAGRALFKVDVGAGLLVRAPGKGSTGISPNTPYDSLSQMLPPMGLAPEILFNLENSDKCKNSKKTQFQRFS